MAFLQSVPPRQPFFRAPAVVLWLIALLVALHVARVLAPPASQSMLMNAYGFIPARYSHAFLTSHGIDPGSVWDRLVPFVSYLGLHGDVTHIAMNSLWLLAFGPIVARRFGTILFLVFFLVCGIAGALTYLALNWGSAEVVIGASGAISGLMGVGLRLLPGQAPWANPADMPMAPLWSRQILMFTAVWLAINLVAGLTGFGLGGGGAVSVAWQAHLGGYVAGLLLAGPFDSLRPRPPARPADLH